MRLIDADALEEEIVKTMRYVPKDAVLDVACSCSHEDDNHIAEDGKKGVKIPVINLEDVSKIIEEMEK